MKKDFVYQEHLKWFTVYTKYILPIWTFLSIILLFLQYSQFDFSNIQFNNLLILAISSDIIYCVLSLKATIDIYGNKEYSIKILLVLFVYNWLYKSLLGTIRSLEVDNYIITFIIFIFAYAIYYIPNIIYFYHRKEIFYIEKKEDNEEQITPKITWQEFLQKHSVNKGTRTTLSDIKIIECKVCGKQIPYNEYGTCEECHHEILKRIEEKTLHYCTNCGQEIKSDWKFCNYCGYKLKD